MGSSPLPMPSVRRSQSQTVLVEMGYFWRGGNGLPGLVSASVLSFTIYMNIYIYELKTCVRLDMCSNMWGCAHVMWLHIGGTVALWIFGSHLGSPPWSCRSTSTHVEAPVPWILLGWTFTTKKSIWLCGVGTMPHVNPISAGRAKCYAAVKLSNGTVDAPLRERKHF